jgi:hypothetical protein
LNRLYHQTINDLDINDIRRYITKIPFVKQIYNIEQGDFLINGKVEIAFEGLVNSLNIEFEIAPQYPLKSYDSESITFRNKELISYNHVMDAGNICIHTSHSTDLEKKLYIDFESLKNWITKYYINKDKDTEYEHIIIKENTVNDQFYGYCFTDCETTFIKDEFGDVNLSYLNAGFYKGKTILNFIVQGFIPINKNVKKCQWSNNYQNRIVSTTGFYYFIEETPAILNKFGFSQWIELGKLIQPDFLNKLHNFEKQQLNKSNNHIIPLFMGYRINDNEIHWQVALLELGKFPLIGVPQKINNVKTGIWNSELTDEKITWGLSRDTSYKYFFGRGAFDEKLTNSKILIIGVGAIGSMIATTLTRGGCRYIDFVDYDVKEPENVCRSEYAFSSGITNKTDELTNILIDISPFVNIKPLNNKYFETLIKTFHSDNKYREKFVNDLNYFDLILDCSTDNDLMFVLNSLDLKTDLVNISITNHAKELVCAFHPNIYRFVNNQFSNILKNDVEDLYNPTGCWNPTFKASYNDINVLVQLALRHINHLYKENRIKNNFVIHEEAGNLKIIEF